MKLLVFEKLSKVLKKLSFSALEPTFHIFAAYLLNQKLKKWEEEGSISEFKSRISRTQKHHYKMELELSLTGKQVEGGILNLVESLPIDRRR